jgi:hypothetical protein
MSYKSYRFPLINQFCDYKFTNILTQAYAVAFFVQKKFERLLICILIFQILRM